MTKTPGHTTGWVASTQYHCLVYTGNLPSFFGNPSNLGILDWYQFRIPTLLFKARFRKSHFGVDCSCLPISSRLLCLHTKQINVYQNPFYFPYGHLDYDPNLLQVSIRTLNLAHKMLPSTPVRQTISVRHVWILTLCPGYPRMESVPHLLHKSRCRERSQSVSTGG